MKRMLYRSFVLSLLMLFAVTTYGQKEKKQRNWTLNGHLENLGTLWVQDWDGRWQGMNQIKNRFDFRWYPTDGLSMHIGMRNNITFGMIPQLYYPYMADVSMQDAGYLDMTRLVGKDTSYYMISNFDRAYLRYAKNNFQVTLGRQRINWGINLVWTLMISLTPSTILILITSKGPDAMG